MVNHLEQLKNPQINYLTFYEVMRDFRKGGLNPGNFDQFIALIETLPPINQRSEKDYAIFDKLNLSSIREDEFDAILREIMRRSIEESKICWHPEASSATCKTDKKGNVIISAAHSVQNNGILSKIAKDGHVMTYALDGGDFSGSEIGKNRASVFYGFCNVHDVIFSPIETIPYTGTEEQNFLFAYRGFVAAAHKKIETSKWMNFGEQAINDLMETKKIFDEAIIKKDYSIINTCLIELPATYPIATSAGFYLDFDFNGIPIRHSDERMEFIFISLVPSEKSTYFLLSHFKSDNKLYGNLCQQLKERNNFKSDITMLIAGHVENVYFDPIYYKTFIEKHEASLKQLMMETQIDIGKINDDNLIESSISFTPADYLLNKYGINFFGY